MHEIDKYNYGDKVTFIPSSLTAAKWMRTCFGSFIGERARIVFRMPNEKRDAMNFRNAARKAGFGIEIHLI